MAAAAAETAEKKGGGNPVVCHALAMYYSEAGQFSKAAVLEQRYVENGNADKDAVGRAAGWYLKAGNAAAALPLAEQSARSDPKTAYEWSQAFLEHQDFTPAAELTESALQSFPGDLQLTLALGVARYGQRRFDDAIAIFLKIIQTDSKINQPYIFLGRMLDQTGSKLPEVTADYRKWADQEPGNSKAWLLLGKALLTGDSRDPSVEPLFRKSIALDPNEWESHYELGVLLAGKRQYPEAAEELTHSIELSFEQPAPHYQLSRVYDRLGYPDRAKAERDIHQKLTAPGRTGMQ